MSENEQNRKNLSAYNYARLHAVMFGLIYPAFLGAFVVTMFLKKASPSTLWMATLLCIYFVVQFAEGVTKSKRYSIDAACLHIAEATLMIILFFGLGYFDTEPAAEMRLEPIAMSVILMTVLMLPAARRLHVYYDESFGIEVQLRSFYITITCLAILAGIVGLFWQWSVSKVILTLFLIFYLFHTLKTRENVTQKQGKSVVCLCGGAH